MTTTKTINPGDLVRLTRDALGMWSEWHGMECRVLSVRVERFNSWAALQPLTERPDGYGLRPVSWPLSELERAVGA